MEKSGRGIHEMPNLLQALPSPSSSGSHNHYNNSSGSSSMLTSSDIYQQQQQHSNPSTPRTPTGQALISSSTTTRSEAANNNNNNHPYPTTFVQADTCSFKQVVQMLTGSSETVKLASRSSPGTPSSDPNASHQPRNHHHHQIPPIRPVSKPKPSRLLERRNSQKALRLSPVIPGGSASSIHNLCSPRHYTAEILSPSLLDFPSLVLSPVTPLIPDPFNRSSSSLYPTAAGQTRCAAVNNNNNAVAVDKMAEEKAIAEKGFYLHRSPATTPRDSSEPPRLLPLFPVTSPKVSGSD